MADELSTPSSPTNHAAVVKEESSSSPTPHADMVHDPVLYVVMQEGLELWKVSRARQARQDKLMKAATAYLTSKWGGPTIILAIAIIGLLALTWSGVQVDVNRLVEACLAVLPGQECPDVTPPSSSGMPGSPEP